LRRITLIGGAMALTALGWTLMWAAALKLVLFVPVSAAVLMFVSGLALIPLATRRKDKSAPARADERRPKRRRMPCADHP
jgi:membrane protein implicated in regulation of membrane protease activity